MEATNISNFLPDYPLPSDKNYYKDIYRKKEFYDEKLLPFEPRPVFNMFPYNLYSHQRFISRFMSSNTPNNKILLLHEMGCLDPKTPVLTYSGLIKLAKYITKEDKLIGDDGKVRNILELKSGISNMYKISQRCSDSYIVNEDHIITIKIDGVHPIYNYSAESQFWTLKWFNAKEMRFTTKTKKDKDELIKFASNLPLKIQDTFDIPVKKFLTLHSETRRRSYGFRLNKPIVGWPERPTPSDPFMYGTWLRTNYTTLESIPEEFLYNSVENRELLLQGLSDMNNVIEIKNKNLVESITFLTASLGLEYIYEYGVMLPVYSNLHKTINIEPIGMGEYVGWRVDSNGRFLLGDFTVTHNSGKSCSAVAIAEQIKSENSDINGVIYIAPKTIVNNFILELGENCVPNTYYKKQKYISNEKEKISEIRKKTRGYYKFYTFNDFSNEVEKLTTSLNITEKYSNKVIIIDEVHNLREDAVKYNNIKKVCREALNTKIVLLSGTPMRDRPDEISSILNLMLKKDIPTGEKFVKEYLNYLGENIYSIQQEKIASLKKIFKGKISYISSMESFATKKYIGDTTLASLVLDTDQMSNFQESTYRKAYENDVKKVQSEEDEVEEAVVDSEEDTKSKAFYLNSRQASLFVYPPIDKTQELGLYGKEGFNAYFRKKDNSYIMKDELRKLLLGNSVQSTINNISKYSSKYAKTISQIVNDKEDRCVFIYCDKVKGSGSILFSKLLELVGFSEATGNESSPGNRYALLTSLSSNKILKIRNRFNDADNCFGKYIKVIIGSAIVSEGFSLKHIRQEHILTPAWNYTPIAQALARGIRVGSHDILASKMDRDDIDIQIYHHVSMPKNTASIDMRMYKTSENKDISIKRIERLLKESAVDCSLAYNRNYKPSAIDGSRDCDYDKCEYKCDDIEFDEMKDLSDDELDKSTYQLYYAKNRKEISEKIKNMFSTTFKLFLDDILSNKNFKQYTRFEIINVIRSMIDENDQINNKYGFISFLREDGNILFLVDSLSSAENYLSSFYTENPFITATNDFNILTDNIYYNDENLDIIASKMVGKNPNEITEILKSLPLKVQELFIEVFITTILINDGEGLNDEYLKLGKFILDFYDNYIHALDEGEYVSTFLQNTMKITRCVSNDKWDDCSEELLNKFTVKVKSKTDEIDKNAERLGIKGIYDKQLDKLYIKDLRIDKSAKRTGMNCMSWKAPTLVRLMVDLNIDVDRDTIYFQKPRNELEELIGKSKIRDVFKDKDLKDVSDDELSRAMYWLIGKKDCVKLCDIMKDWLIAKNVVEFTDKKTTLEKEDKKQKPTTTTVDEEQSTTTTKKKRGRPKKVNI